MAENAEYVERILASKTHFDVFDIPPVAVDVDVIKKLYRRLALKVHPDKCSHADGPAAFRRLAEANDVLGDKSEQRNYVASFSWKAAAAERAAAADKNWREQQMREAARAARAAAEQAEQDRKDREERAFQKAMRADKKREKDLRKQQAEAAAAREAAFLKAKEDAETKAKEEAARQARDEARKKAKSLQKARRRLRTFCREERAEAAADQAANEERRRSLAAADGGGSGSGGGDGGSGAAGTGAGNHEGGGEHEGSFACAGCVLTDEEVELLCARLPEEELEKVLVALLVGDHAAATAAAQAATAAAAAEAEEAAALAQASAKRARAAANARAAAAQWSERERTALVKTAKTQGLTFTRPGGHADWDAVAMFVSTAADSTLRKGDACRTEFRRLVSEHNSNGNSKNSGSGGRGGGGSGGSPSVNSSAVAAGGGEGGVGTWTAEEQSALEVALVQHPASGFETPSLRWKAIGKAVDGKTAKQCLVRYKAIAAAVKAKARNGI
jgi:curved DNA-binding protein CbpA